MKLTVNPTIKISEIKIGTRFRKDFGEIDNLASSIDEVGLLQSVVIDENNYLIAGQRRLEACKKLGWTEIPIHIVNLENLVKGEFHENFVRKDFTKKEVLAINRALQPKLKQQGKRTDLICADSAQVNKGKKSRDIIAQYAGLSHDTISKLEEIEDESESNPKYQELLDKIDDKNNKETVNSVHLKLKKEKKRQSRQEEIKKIQVNLPDTVTLHNSEFQKVFIPGNSVSLIFTDPPYHEKYLYLYEDLAVHASRVLRDGGSLICYVGHYAIGKVINMMEKRGLKFHWPIAVIHSGPSASVFGRKILVGWKPMLWFTKGKYEGEFVKDLIKSEFQGKELHEWAQSTVESDYFIKYLTIENEIVYDPFLGQGTFGISAVKLGRQFIGCEVDPEHFANAERLISEAKIVC